MRTACLLLVSAVMAFGSGCALDPVDAGEESAPGLAPADDPGVTGESDYGQHQTPPIKLQIISGGMPMISLVSLKASAGTYQGQTEYWFAAAGMKAAMQQTVPTLTLDASPLDLTTDTAVDEWTSPLAVAFSCPREVVLTDWKKGTATLPEGTKPHLYWTASPDDENEILGVLLATNSDGRLVATAWYRSSAPSSSGRAFESQSWRHELAPVFDRDGSPTADPNFIREGDWYNIVMTQK